MAQKESSTIGLTPSAVAVTVKLGTTTVCSSTDVVDNTAKPCLNATESGTGSQLSVNLSYVSTVDLLFANPAFTLTGTGTFRCEYTQ